MLLTRQQLSAALFASDETDTRYSSTLQYVQVDPDGTCWATDGYVAVKVRPQDVPDDTSVPVLSFPEGTKPPSVRVYLPAASALQVAKTIPKTPSHWQYAQLRVTDDTIYLGVPGGAASQIMTIPRPAITTACDIEALFAHYASDQAKPELTSVSAEYLALIAKYRKMFPGNSVRVASRGEDPMVCQWADDSHSVSILLMPMIEGRRQRKR